MTITTQDAANAQPEAAMEMRSKPNITVIDSIMGSGKTSWAIQYINDHPEKNFLYITPFLDEVGRVIESTKHRQPFHQPVNKGTGKLNSLSALLEAGKNIASTHELFRSLNADCREKIQQHGYTLILDEVLDVIDTSSCKKIDIEMMKKAGLISVEPDGEVKWNPKYADYDGTFSKIREMTERGILFYDGNTTLIYQLNPAIFLQFTQVFIMTFMFRASVFRYYMDLNNVSYAIKSICRLKEEDGINSERYDLVPYYRADVSKYREKIHIYSGSLNQFMAQRPTSLSAQWYHTSGNKCYITKIKNNLYNYIRHIHNAKVNEVMWTCFKSDMHKLKGQGYTKGFVPCNCRATNEFSEIKICCYCINLFLNPTITRFFDSKGVYVDQDQYALSEMIQWIWRSAIRNGEDIHVYIPSDRMRRILYDWLGCKDPLNQKTVTAIEKD